MKINGRGGTLHRHGIKDALLDAACVGKSVHEKLFQIDKAVLTTKAGGHGSRQMCRVNKFGFPRTKAKSKEKKIKGFQTGDIVKAIVTSGKKVGTYIGRVAVRKSGSFGILHGCFTVSEAKLRFSVVSPKSVNYFCREVKDADLLTLKLWKKRYRALAGNTVAYSICPMGTRITRHAKALFPPKPKGLGFHS